LSHYLDKDSSAIYTPTELYDSTMNPVWTISCNVAFPCATQNELNLNRAQELINNECICVREGANIPSNADTVDYLEETKNFCMNRKIYKCRWCCHESNKMPKCKYSVI